MVVRVVVMAEYALPAGVVAAVLRGQPELEVTAVEGRERLREPERAGAPGAAQVVVYVPNAPIECIPWREANPGGQALVLVDLGGHVGLDRALRLGARGYVSPHESVAVLVQRVLQAAQGTLAVPPDAVATAEATVRVVAREALRARRLTDPEQQLLRWLANGTPPKVMAARWGITLTAVRGRLQRLRKRLELSSQQEVEVLAVRAGFGTPGDDRPTDGPAPESGAPKASRRASPGKSAGP